MNSAGMGKFCNLDLTIDDHRWAGGQAGGLTAFDPHAAMALMGLSCSVLLVVWSFKRRASMTRRMASESSSILMRCEVRPIRSVVELRDC